MPKKFKEAVAKVVTTTDWICPHCTIFNVNVGSMILYKKKCYKCGKLFLLVWEKS